MSRPVSHFNEQLLILVQTALAEDLGEGDHSTLAAIPADTQGKAILKIKQEGILAVPGIGFGRAGYMRLSLTVTRDEIVRSLPGFGRALRKVTGHLSVSTAKS